MWLGYNYISDVKVLVEDNQQYFMYKVLTQFLFHDDIKPMAWIEDNTLALYPNERYSRSQIVPYYSKEQLSKVEAIKYLMQYQS